MNWGKGLILVMTAFVLFILSLCYVMFTGPNDEYDHQYYEKGLDYNIEYSKKLAVFEDHMVPKLSLNPLALEIVFPKPALGRIYFIRPSNQKMDQDFPFNYSENPIKIPVKEFSKGHWEIRIDWNSHNKAYVFEQGIEIP